MTKLPKVSGNQMIKYLIKKGFFVKSRKGSHVTLANISIRVTIPAGQNMIKPGLFLQILKAVEITRDEFVGDHNKGNVK